MRQTKEEMIAVLQASIDGEEMQARSHRRGKDAAFVNIHDKPSWDFPALEYRAKPKPRQCWVAFSSDGKLLAATESEERSKTGNLHYILMTEQV
jgi:hypothetical protein